MSTPAPVAQPNLARRGVRFALLGCASTALLALAFAQTDIEAAQNVAKSADGRLLFAGCGMMTAGLVFLAARWRALMPTRTKVQLIPLTAILVTGTLLNYALPGPVGEFVAAGMAARRWKLPPEQTFAAGVHAFSAARVFGIGQHAVQIAQRTLSSICRAVGKLQVSNSEQLHLIPLIADVRVRPPKGMYGESNSIRYLPRVGQAANAPTFNTGPANPIAPPAVAPATPAANGLPWKRQA